MLGRLIVMMAHNVLDLYGGVLGHSDAIDELFLKLHKQVCKHTLSIHPLNTPSQHTLSTRPIIVGKSRGWVSATSDESDGLSRCDRVSSHATSPQRKYHRGK